MHNKSTMTFAFISIAYSTMLNSPLKFGLLHTDGKFSCAPVLVLNAAN